MSAAVVSPEFRQRLSVAVASAFNPPQLTRFAQLHLGVNLSSVAPVWEGFEVAVRELVEWAERNGRLGELVTAAAAERLNLVEFQQLRLDLERARIAPPPTADAVAKFATRLRTCIRHLTYPRAVVQMTDVLHDLEAMLPEARREADERRHDGREIDPLLQDSIRGWVAEIEQWARSTEFPDATLRWVVRFRSVADAFLGPDPAGWDRGLAALETLIPQVRVRLNDELVDSVRRLNIPSLQEEGRLLPMASERMARFRDAAARLQPLVHAIDLSQLIDNELRLARSLGGDPLANLRDQGVFQRWVGELASIRPSDLRVARFRQTAAVAEGSPSSSLFEQLDVQAGQLHRKIVVELLDATVALTVATSELAVEVAAEA